MGGIYVNGDRLKKYDYSEKLFDEVIVLYMPAAKAGGFKGIDSLKGMTIGVIRGWSYGDDFDNAVKSGAIKTKRQLTTRKASPSWRWGVWTESWQSGSRETASLPVNRWRAKWLVAPTLGQRHLRCLQQDGGKARRRAEIQRGAGGNAPGRHLRSARLVIDQVGGG